MSEQHSKTDAKDDRGKTRPRGGIPYRVTAVLALACVVATMGLVDRFVRRTDRTPVVPLADAGPIATSDSARSSTWFCTGGTGSTAVTALIANPTDSERRGTVRLIGPTGEIESRPLVLPAGASERFEMPVRRALTSPLAEEQTTNTAGPEGSEGVAVDSAAGEPKTPTEIGDEAKRGVGGVFEFDGGGVTVEHQVEGSIAPCAAAAAPDWVLSDGTTTRDARTTLVLFNPFADDAIVDVTVNTDRGNARPSALQGYVIPSGSVRTVDLERLVRRREFLTASVHARTGRIVSEGFLRFDNTGETQGSTIVQAAPSEGSAWYFPSGRTSTGENPVLREQYLIYNPNDRALTVEIAFISDSREEPFEIEVPARSTAMFNAVDEERVPRSVDYSVAVTSTDNRSFVASRRLIARSQFRKGVSSTLGVRIFSNRWTVADTSATSTTDDRLAIYNPTDDPALVSLFRVDPANKNDIWAPIDGANQIALAGGARLGVRVGDFVAAKRNVIVVVSDGAPVIVDRSRVSVRNSGDRPARPTLIASIPENAEAPVDGLPDSFSGDASATEAADDGGSDSGEPVVNVNGTETPSESPETPSTRTTPTTAPELADTTVAAAIAMHAGPLRGYSVAANEPLLAISADPSATSNERTRNLISALSTTVSTTLSTTLSTTVSTSPSSTTVSTSPSPTSPTTSDRSTTTASRRTKSTQGKTNRVAVAVVANAANGTSTAGAIPSAG